MADIARKSRPQLIVVGASAYPRIIDFKAVREIADEVGAMVMADIAHIAGLVAAGAHPSPVPYCEIITTTTHKTLRGPRGALIMCKQELAPAIDRTVFPGTQGGPFMHAIAAKAVAFKEALTQEFKDYQFQVVKNAAVLAERLKENDFDLVSGGTDNHLMLVKLLKEGITGKEADETLERAGITLNKNMIPFDPATPFVTSGNQDRHTIGYYAGHEGEGDGADRRFDNYSSQRHQERDDCKLRENEGEGALRSVPGLS